MLNNWINVDDKMPKVGQDVWYYFNLVGCRRGKFKGYYEDDAYGVRLDMHIFANDYGFLTGNVTHWHLDQEEVPYGP
jgi:hypothetical protein|tara:strand:- start:403 stop:633 length:231 start_codon:yes stop_codon:yes gene_type:complete